MLNKLMGSYEFLDEIEKIVVESPEFKEKENECLNALKSLDLDRKTHDEVDATVTSMIDASRKFAYKIGFQNGVALVTECNAGRKSDFGKAWKHIEVKQAWDKKAEARNNLVDVLIDKGIGEIAAVCMVNEVVDSSENFGSMTAKYGCSESTGKCIGQDSTLNELQHIVGQLSLKNLYSLLGCARGLLKSQKQTKDLRKENMSC